MTAVDTDVLVRLLTGDEPGQAAEAVLAAEPIWIAKTVLLETAWVLRRRFCFFRPGVRSAQRARGGRHFRLVLQEVGRPYVSAVARSAARVWRAGQKSDLHGDGSGDFGARQ